MIRKLTEELEVSEICKYGYIGSIGLCQPTHVRITVDQVPGGTGGLGLGGLGPRTQKH
jgi:hypothetical protein